MTEKARMIAGMPYRGSDPELVEAHLRCQDMLVRLNAGTARDRASREALLRGLFGELGKTPNLRTPFFCDYGFNIRLGKNAFINFNCVFLDCAEILIGDNLQMGPLVQLYTALHPIDPDERRSGIESAKPIVIGHDVWIGGGAVVLPGVSIGDAAVVGAGSVVTRDVPARSVAAGNPARVIRKL